MNVTHHATTARLPLSNVANHNQPQLASPLISPPTAADNDAPEVADALDNPTALKKPSVNAATGESWPTHCARCLRN